MRRVKRLKDKKGFKSKDVIMYCMNLDEMLLRTGISPPHRSKKTPYEHIDLYIAGKPFEKHIPFNLDNLVEYGGKFGVLLPNKLIRRMLSGRI